MKCWDWERNGRYIALTIFNYFTVQFDDCFPYEDSQSVDFVIVSKSQNIALNNSIIDPKIF